MQAESVQHRGTGDDWDIELTAENADYVRRCAAAWGCSFAAALIRLLAAQTARLTEP